MSAQQHTRTSAVTAYAMAVFVLASFSLLALILPAESFAMQTGTNDWRVGNQVGLSRGTQIRQGPGFGYCYHTTVPENNWTVVVIGGPRIVDNRTWYDTSRLAAGDPSGGTGWVNIEQVDSSPVPHDPGPPCSTSPGTITPPPPLKIGLPQFLIDIERWWRDQQLPVKVGVVVVALALLIMSGRYSMAGNRELFGFVRAVLLGVALGGIADLTRQWWEPGWFGLVGGPNGIDLAMVLLVGPVLWWALGLLFNIASKAVGIAALAVIIVLLLAFLAPDRLNDLGRTIQGWLGGAR